MTDAELLAQLDGALPKTPAQLRGLARGAAARIRELIAVTKCPIGMDDSREFCSAGSCPACLGERLADALKREEAAERERDEWKMHWRSAALNARAERERDDLRDGLTDRASAWINVDERVPKTTSPVLGWRAGARHPALVYPPIGGHGWSNVFGYECVVTHWMPLPEPPSRQREKCTCGPWLVSESCPIHYHGPVG